MMRQPRQNLTSTIAEQLPLRHEVVESEHKVCQVGSYRLPCVENRHQRTGDSSELDSPNSQR